MPHQLRSEGIGRLAEPPCANSVTTERHSAHRSEAWAVSSRVCRTSVMRVRCDRSVGPEAVEADGGPSVASKIATSSGISASHARSLSRRVSNPDQGMSAFDVK